MNRLFALALALLLLGASGFLVAPSAAQIGGNYPPVVAGDLIGKQSSHRTGRVKFKFVWKFEENTFEIEGESIPEDLQEELLGRKMDVEKIEGTWELKDETIHFEVKRLDGMAVEMPKRTLKTFNTGVTRIQTKAAQYVF